VPGYFLSFLLFIAQPFSNDVQKDFELQKFAGFGFFSENEARPVCKRRSKLFGGVTKCQIRVLNVVGNASNVAGFTTSALF
jgi:hypothetical protein